MFRRHRALNWFCVQKPATHYTDNIIYAVRRIYTLRKRKFNVTLVHFHIIVITIDVTVHHHFRICEKN